MWTSASVFFLLTILCVDALRWIKGYNEKECRDDKSCRCKVQTDNSVIEEWRGGIESCTCFMNKKFFTEDENLNNCIPKCRNDGWYAVKQICGEYYFCATREGDAYKASMTTDKDKWDCTIYNADDIDEKGE